uniref:Uncharacterized protein n=1 Tax=Caenorhabditis japonica TaxID=281687 RepID=A0A8R1I7X1_CAEJA
MLTSARFFLLWTYHKGRHNRSSVSRHGRSQNRSTQIHHGNEHEDKRSRGIGRRPRLESVEAAPKEVKEKKEDPAEINERRRSIVAIGVPEATITLMFEISVADINAVNELLKCVDATSPPVTAYRLGRQREDSKHINLFVFRLMAKSHFSILIILSLAR